MSVGHGGRDRSSERLTELEHLVSSSRGRKYSEQPDFADDGAPKTTVGCPLEFGNAILFIRADHFPESSDVLARSVGFRLGKKASDRWRGKWNAMSLR